MLEMLGVRIAQCCQTFEENPLENAYYYPTQARDITYEARKMCLSPKMKSRPTADTDLLQPNEILAYSGRLQRDLIPTKDIGMGDNSGSSKFDETWPSTDLTENSKGESPSQGSTSDKTGVGSWFENKEFAGKGQDDENGPKGTIARYIHRFRNEPPKSRRDRLGSGGERPDEFWWTAEPDSSSTPRESDSSSFSPPIRLRDSVKGTGKFGRRPPISPDQKRTHPGWKSSPIKQTKGALKGKENSQMDADVDKMQQRAQRLIEMSESTLSTSSTDVPFPKGTTRTSSIEPALSSKITREASKTEFKPRSEDDILYQWRLARKMEQARQGGNVFSKLPHMQRSHIQKVSRGANPEANFDAKGTQLETNAKDLTPNVNSTGNVRSTCTQVDGKFVEENSKSVEAQTTSTRTRSILRETDFETGMVPSHFHAACDIVPCPHVGDTQRHGVVKICPLQEDKLKSSSFKNRVRWTGPSVASNGYKDNRSRSVKSSRKTVGRDDDGEIGAEGSGDRRIGRIAEQMKCNSLGTDVDTHSPENDGEDSKASVWGREDGATDKISEAIEGSGRRKNGANGKIAEAIDEAVSANLFTASLSDGSLSSSIEKECKKQNGTGKKESPIFIDPDLSDGEFPDDDLLKILRLRRQNFLIALNEVENFLEEFPDSDGGGDHS